MTDVNNFATWLLSRAKVANVYIVAIWSPRDALTIVYLKYEWLRW